MHPSTSPRLRAIALLALLLIASACVPTAPLTPTLSPRDPASDNADPASDNADPAPTPRPIEVSIEPLQLAPLGRTMRLGMTIEAQSDVNAAELYVALPKGIAPVAGKTHRWVRLARRIPQSFSLDVLLLEPGRQEVSAGVSTITHGGTLIGDVSRLALDVSPSGTDASPLPTPADGSWRRLPLLNRREFRAAAARLADQDDDPPVQPTLTCAGGAPRVPLPGRGAWSVTCSITQAPLDQHFARLSAWLIGPDGVIAIVDLCTTQLRDGNGECGEEVSVADPGWRGTALAVGTLLPSQEIFGPAAVLAEIEP